jgi:hypothetical protein
MSDRGKVSRIVKCSGTPLRLGLSTFPLFTFITMAPDPRLSDKELAAINAAAVTQEYRVQPHLGEFQMDSLPAHN